MSRKKKRTKDINKVASKKLKKRLREPQKSRLYLAIRKAEGKLPPTPKPRLRERFLGRIAKIFGAEIIQKAQRAPIPSYIFETVPTIIEPPHDQIGLFETFLNSWVTRQVNRAICQEVLGAGTDEPSSEIKPKFAKKCTTCGKEFDDAVKECDYCKSHDKEHTLRDPDESQRREAVHITTNPNPDYNFFHLLKTSLAYLNGLDDFYWSIVYGYELDIDKGELVRKPMEVYVEDSRFIRPVADGLGHLGSDDYFCPECYNPRNDSPRTKLDPAKTFEGHIPVCPNCKKPMIQTCWVQQVGGKITARLGRDEIVHGSEERVLPELFGNPKMKTIQKLNEMIMAMDEYNLGVYSEGKVGSLVVFPGMTQDSINDMLLKAKQEIEKKEKEDIQTGKLIAKKKVRTIFLGVKESPVRIPIMEDFEKMQSLEFYKLAVEKICSVYGVTPVFVSIIESGKAGNNPRMQIDVQNRTTREKQNTLESVINNQLFPLFGITDWLFEFSAIEQKDELREIQIEQIKAATANAWIQAGFEVTIDEDGNLEVSGTAKPEKPPEEAMPPSAGPPGEAGTPKPPVESEASGDLLQRQEVETIRMPVSWYDATKITINGVEFSLVNDREEVFLAWDRKEVPNTRISTTRLGDAIALLIGSVMNSIHSKVAGTGFDESRFTQELHVVTQGLRREFDPNRWLIPLANYLENIGLKETAQKIDNLRTRLEKLKPSTFEEVS